MKYNHVKHVSEVMLPGHLDCLFLQVSKSFGLRNVPDVPQRNSKKQFWESLFQNWKPKASILPIWSKFWKFWNEKFIFDETVVISYKLKFNIKILDIKKRYRSSDAGFGLHSTYTVRTNLSAEFLMHAYDVIPYNLYVEPLRLKFGNGPKAF